MTFEKAVAAEIKRLKGRIVALTSVIGSGGGAPKLRGASRKSKTARKPRRRLSPKVRAQRVLQGTYMGVVRHLSGEQKKRVSEIRQKSGYRKAIAEAKRMASKK